MAPTSLHALLPRHYPSLGEMFHQFPAKVWLILKEIIFGLAIILALVGFILVIISIFVGIRIYGPHVVNRLRGGEWRDVVEGLREKVGRLRKIERVDRMWKWLERRMARTDTDKAVSAATLELLDSREGEGSVGGETLFEGEEDEDEKWTRGQEG